MTDITTANDADNSSVAKNEISIHPSISFVVTGYTERASDRVKAAYPLLYKFAHMPQDPAVKYRWHYWPEYKASDDHKVHTCQFCHPQQKAVENYSGNVQG